MDSTTRALVGLALAEDLGPGDLSSSALPDSLRGSAKLLAKSPLVLAGLDVFEEVFRQLDAGIDVARAREDGDALEPGTVAATVSGPLRRILEGERTALNFVQRLSGVATLARAAARAVEGSGAVVVDTRKTTPGMRSLEKAAVAAGGAKNHRFGLFDGVLMKDNHIDALGGVGLAVAAARRVAHHLVRVECEVRTLDELEAALDAGADVVLLDNMDLEQLRAAVARRAARGSTALLEASGNVTLERLPEIARTGVDLISMGALTHSAPSADLSLKVLPA